LFHNLGAAARNVSEAVAVDTGE